MHPQQPSAANSRAISTWAPASSPSSDGCATTSDKPAQYTQGRPSIGLNPAVTGFECRCSGVPVQYGPCRKPRGADRDDRMQALFDDPMVQAGVAPFAVALLVAVLLARAAPDGSGRPGAGGRAGDHADADHRHRLHAAVGVAQGAAAGAAGAAAGPGAGRGRPAPPAAGARAGGGGRPGHRLGLPEPAGAGRRRPGAGGWAVAWACSWR
jgi:hypothetical protein